MKIIYYLAPFAPAKFSYSNKPFVNGPKPAAVVADYGSITPRFRHVDLETGERLTVETGKGYLIGII